MKALLGVSVLFSFAALPTARAEVVKLCVEHWPPYTVVKDGKVTGGTTVDIANEAFRRIGGYTLEIDYLPFARCLAMVKEGERDAVADASASQTDEFKMIVGKNMTSLWSLAVWVREDDPQKVFKSLDDYKGKRVGLVESYEYPDSIKNFKQWKVDYATTDQSNLGKLEAKRFDIAISDIVNTLAVVSEKKLKVRYLSPAIVSDPLYIAFTVKKPDIRDKFDAALAAMVKDGTADAIYQKHIGEKYSVLNKMP